MSVYRRGRVYYYDFAADGARYVKRVGPSKSAAQEAERVARQRALDQRYQREWGLRPRRAAPTLQAFVKEEYLPEIRTNLASQTARKGTEILTRLCRDFFGHLRLDQLTIAELERYKAARLTTVRPSFLHVEVDWLRRCYEAARRRGYVVINPFRRLPMPRKMPQQFRILGREEQEQLLAAVASPVARAAFRFMLLTGLRRGEVVALRWRHLDLEGGRLTLIQPKTAVRKRLPLIPEAVELLRTLRPGVVDLERPIFPARGRRSMEASTLNYHFARARRAANITRIRLHDLRHTVATRLAQAGFDLATVGEILGHRPPYRQTLVYFAHTSEDRMRDALSRLATAQSPTGKA